MSDHSDVDAQVHLDATQLWHGVLADLQQRLPRATFDNWVRDTALIAFDDDRATVAARGSAVVSTLTTRFSTDFADAISQMVGRPVQVSFIEALPDLGSAERAVTRPPRSQRAPKRTQATPLAVDGAVPAMRQAELAALPESGLNPRYRFSSYVVGASNRFAHAASLSVAEQPGGKYNPLFIHGGVGLGKTHLQHALGHHALDIRPHLRVSYVTSEKFTNDLIGAIRAQRMDDFRSRYREIDILMIDDIQFIAGKESTQEEFFHTFNALYQSGKQVVITSDRPPRMIASLEDRLRSRFEGGLIADVQLPDYEMRIAILRNKAERLEMLLPADVVEYIAQRDQSNIRELEGALNKVIARAQLGGEPVTLAVAIDALADLHGTTRRTNISKHSIIAAVAKRYAVTLDDLHGRSRSRDIVVPRQVAMYLLREETGASLQEIGELLGNRDHTTVMHGIKQVERSLPTNNDLRSHILHIQEMLYAGL